MLLEIQLQLIIGEIFFSVVNVTLELLKLDNFCYFERFL